MHGPLQCVYFYILPLDALSVEIRLHCNRWRILFCILTKLLSITGLFIVHNVSVNGRGAFALTPSTLCTVAFSVRRHSIITGHMQIVRDIANVTEFKLIESCIAKEQP